MDTIIKMLDKSLDYIYHEFVEETLYITVSSNMEALPCPKCKSLSNKVHSRYKKNKLPKS